MAAENMRLSFSDSFVEHPLLDLIGSPRIVASMSKYTESQAIALHLLAKPIVVRGVEHTTGFWVALKDARATTNRDRDGVKLPSRHHDSWAGALGYMALLDQIGKCFNPREEAALRAGQEAANQEPRPIIKALLHFSELVMDQIKALYALRCAFAHDFSLINVNPKDAGLTHHFHVCGGSAGDVITLPKARWDGDFKRRTIENLTHVNLELFGDLVEAVSARITTFAEKETLEVILAGGPDELIERYSLLVRN
jgi:hypothetical protein